MDSLLFSFLSSLLLSIIVLAYHRFSSLLLSLFSFQCSRCPKLNVDPKPNPGWYPLKSLKVPNLLSVQILWILSFLWEGLSCIIVTSRARVEDGKTRFAQGWDIRGSYAFVSCIMTLTLVSLVYLLTLGSHFSWCWTAFHPLHACVVSQRQGYTYSWMNRKVC